MRGKTTFWLAVIQALLLLASLTSKVESATPVATVQLAIGSFTVRRQGATQFIPIGIRGSLYVGDMARTGARSKASLLFNDGSQVRLNENTTILITPPTPVGKGKRSLFRAILGETWASLRPDQAAQTTSAIAGVRGTEFDLKVEEDGTTTITVLVGEVDFFNDFGAVVVGESQQSIARPGQPPTAPITIANANLIIEWTFDLDQAVIPREKFFITYDRRALKEELEQRAERVRKEPNSADARVAYGDALFDNGNYEEALKEYQEADRITPNQASILTRLGYTLLELDRREESERAFQRAIQVSPQYASAYIGIASLLLARDRPQEAQTFAEKAVNLNPSSAEAYIALGLSQMRQPGKLESAKASFQSALKVPPAFYHYQARAWLSLIYLAQEDESSALDEAQLATQLAPQSALAHGNLALVYFFTGRHLSAEREARTASRLNPDSVSARVALGQVLLAQGDVDGAARVAAQAVALDPKLPQARYLLGVADAQRRDYTHAVRSLREALRLTPDYLPAVSLLARVYTLMGRDEEAVNLLTNLLPRHRKKDEVLAALGSVYYRQGRYKEAVDQYKEAIKLKPNSALYHAELARLLLDYNRLSEAMATALKAVQSAPQVAQYHAILGLCYDFSGLKSQAERQYREALSLDPQNSLARARLALIAFDPTTQVNSITQAFLFDPAISIQLMRGGVTTDVTTSVATEGQWNLDVEHRRILRQGAFHEYGIADRGRNSTFPGDNLDEPPNRNRRREGRTTTTYLQNITLVADPQTIVSANLLGLRERRRLPGPANHPQGEDLNDHSSFRGDIYQLSYKRRIGLGQHLWLGMTYEPFRNILSSPDKESFPPSPLGPTSEIASRARIWVPELRFDFSLNRSPEKPVLLTMGVSRVLFSAKNRIEADIGSIEQRVDGRLWTSYLQLSQRITHRFSFVTQMRLHHSDIETRINGAPSGARRKQLLLPSLIITYFPDQRSTLRFFYNRQTQEGLFTTLPFVPTETLLTTEKVVLPQGLFLFSRTFEIDYERYLSSKGLLKFFLFHTLTRDHELGGQSLPAFSPPSIRMARVRRVGFGLRYEHQITPNLYANLIYSLNNTTNRTPGAPYDGKIAPYQPKHTTTLSLDYVDPTGTKVRLRVRNTGGFFQDSPLVQGRPRFPARTIVDLMFAKEPTVYSEFFITLFNIFNSQQILFNEFPTDGRVLVIGYTRRF